MLIQKYHLRFQLLSAMQTLQVTGWKLISYRKRIRKSVAEQQRKKMTV